MWRALRSKLRRLTFVWWVVAPTWTEGHVAEFGLYTVSRLAIRTLAPLALAIATISAAKAATNLPPSAVWDNTAQVTTGFGYRDNALKSSVATESSAFVNVAADASFLRLADSGAYLTFFLLGDHTQYFDAPSLDCEQFFLGTAQYVTPIGIREEAGGQFNYLYQHQILDVSETEAVLTRVLVDGHTFTLQPHWKHMLSDIWAVKLEGLGLRQMYAGELDDYWDGSGRLSLIRTYGNRSEISLSYQSLLRFFDTREQFDNYGVIIPGTSLYYWQHEIVGRWRHHWDTDRHWRTTSKLSYMFNRDNGSGYFDYDRLLFSEQLRWAAENWEVKANVRLGWYYYYQEQQVANEGLKRSYVVLDVRVERRIWKHGLLYAVVEREWNNSNDPLEDYDDWMAGGGIGLEF